MGRLEQNAESLLSYGYATRKSDLDALFFLHSWIEACVVRLVRMLVEGSLNVWFATVTSDKYHV